MRMFKRVGKEIKTWAKVLVILQMIPVVLLGLAACCGGFVISDGMNESLYAVVGIVVGILIIVLGYLLARLSAILLYAKGEAVDRLMRIDERLERLEKRNPTESAGTPPTAPNPGFTPGGFYPPVRPTPIPRPAPAPVPPVPAPAPAPVVQEPVDEEMTIAATSSPVDPEQTITDWFCPVCGQKNPFDGSWCRNCGTKRNR